MIISATVVVVVIHADESRVSKAFSGVCDSVHVFVCLSAR